MALCGVLLVNNYTTAARPSVVNGGLYFDTDTKQMHVGCNSTWHKVSCNVVQGPITVCYALAAGGGAGGSGNGGGGGGAGGYVHTETPLNTLQWYCVSIGAGGAGPPSFWGQGNNGSDSCFAGITATGGGRGGGHACTPCTPLGNAASDGGSGGGAGQINRLALGQGTAGQGNRGGAASGPCTASAPGGVYETGGGGGGAASTGCAGCGPFSGTDGIGGTSDITCINPAFPAVVIQSRQRLSKGGGGGGGQGYPFPGALGVGCCTYCGPSNCEGGGRGGCNAPAPSRFNGGNACAASASGGGGGPGDTPSTGRQGAGGSGALVLVFPNIFTYSYSPTLGKYPTLCNVNGCCLVEFCSGSGCVCFEPIT